LHFSGKYCCTVTVGRDAKKWCLTLLCQVVLHFPFICLKKILCLMLWTWSSFCFCVGSLSF
jgi:hypothetical protein